MRRLPNLFFIMASILFAVQAGSNVSIGPGHFLQIQGQRIFPIGAYGLPKEMNDRDAKDLGFNLVRVSTNEEDWANAKEAGLWVWHSFGHTLDLSEKTDTKKKRIQDLVKQYSNHSQLLFWESVDEPAWTNKKHAIPRVRPEGLIEGYKYLKSLDPDHPVYLNHAPRNTVATLRRYNPACDIVCADIYPIIPPGLGEMYAITPDGRHGDLPNQTPSCVGEYAGKMKQVAGAHKSVFLVLQGFAWESLRGEDSDPELIRYPTFHESRFMAYHAIVHGVRGLMYWGLHYVPSEHSFLQDLSKVLNEINDLTPSILGRKLLHQPTLRYHERGSTITNGIEMLCTETDNQITLFAVNTSIDPAAADFHALPTELKNAQQLEVVGENRMVSIRNHSFFDEFEGLDVHIYVYKKNN